MTSSSATKTAQALHEKRIKAMEEITSVRRASTAIGFFPVIITGAATWLVRGVLTEVVGLSWWASIGVALIFGAVMLVGVFAFFTWSKHARLNTRIVGITASWEKTLRSHLKSQGKDGDIEFQSDLFAPRCAVKHLLPSGIEYFSLVDDGSKMEIRQ